MKVFIHLGIHKTASTFIQTQLFTSLKSTKFLNRQEIKDFKNYILHADDFDFTVNEARNIFNSIIESYHYTENFLISDEEFYGNPYMGGIDRKRIIDRLILVFPDNIYFMIFLRNQVSLMLSLYSYYIKSGGTANIKNFLYYKKYPLIINEGHFKYDAYLDYIIQKTSRNKLKVLLYEDFVKYQSQTIAEILEFVEEPIFSVELNSKKTNKSLSYSMLKYVRFFNKFVKSSKQPFLLLPKHFHGVMRIFFESFEVKDKKTKSHLLNTIHEDKAFIDAITVSNHKLQHMFINLNLEEHKYLT